MSSRALRKAQREKEEQERLRKLEEEENGTGHDDEEEEEEDEAPAPAARKSAFAMLGEVVEDEADEQEDEQEDGGVSIPDEPIEEARPAKAASASKKKKKKKNKTKPAAVSTPEGGDTSVDEIDEALRQLATSKAGGAAQKSSDVDGEVLEACQLLAVDSTHLHAQNEMRRLFGRAALEQDEDDDAGAGNAAAGGNRRQQRRVQQAGLAQALRGQRGQGRAGGLGALGLRRNIFIQGKEEWPVATGGGLGMEVVEKHADGTVEYRYVHNRGYQDVQSQFESCVASYDPNRLVVLLQHNPYHISTLLQVSEIAKQERDHTTSGDLLERALFSFGRAVHSTFAKSLSEGRARLDFKRPENREFWLTAWRYMQNLSMRATWRTVYEWAKLILSLSPEEDPYAMWLVLDQYALRSKQDIDYINISRNALLQVTHEGMPHVQLSCGLAEYRSGDKSKGQQALFKAIGKYPWVVARLMQELNLDPPPAIWGKEPRTDKEKFYTELYATRAKDLWNTPETAALLTEISSALPPELKPSDPDTDEITENEARHVLLADSPSLIALVPRNFTARLTSSSDPLPPASSIASYRPAAATRSANTARSVGSPAENLRELQGLQRFFTNLFPWFHPGAGEAAPDAEQAQPTEDEVDRRIRESGVDEAVIVERTQRMMELQRRLLGEMDDAGNEAFAAQVAGEPDLNDEGREQHARVEDASDDEQ